jgi:CheY-like chemotaxis protein
MAPKMLPRKGDSFMETDMDGIFVIEDDDDTRESIVAMLELCCNHRATGFKTIEEASGALASAQPFLILLDVVMRGSEASAEEFVRRARAICQPRIMLVSGLNPKVLEEKVRELKVDGYIFKPFEPAELISYVKKLKSPVSNGA